MTKRMIFVCIAVLTLTALAVLALFWTVKQNNPPASGVYFVTGGQHDSTAL